MRRGRGRPPAGEPGEGPDQDPEEVARLILLRALTERARSRRELSDLLDKRGIPEEARDAILGRFSEVGLIDDSAFAAAWVEDRQQRRGLSKRALRAELVRKGIERDEIDEALEQVSGEDEYAAALELARVRAARMTGLDRATRYRRLAGLLGRRGFSAGVVSGVLREVLNVEEEF